MNFLKSNIVNLLVLSCLIVMTIAMAVNNYNSGVYEDAHGLVGGTVGWFAPIGVLVFLITSVVTITFAVYIVVFRSHKHR